VRALIGDDEEGKEIGVMSERGQTCSKNERSDTVMYLPVDLTHVPPHVPRPLQDVVSLIVIASDGVHGRNDRLGTPALPSHYPIHHAMHNHH
jgi:hypothetical protein